MGIIINEDNSHFCASRPIEKMNLQHLHEFVDQYAQTQVTHLFLNTNAMRSNFKSKTRDAIWDGNTTTDPHLCPGEADSSGAVKWQANQWVQNTKFLHDNNIDIYEVWIQRCRQKNISPWITMRMNDVHSTEELDNFMHSTFWKQHPEYWRVPNSPRSYNDRALDYGVEEVRQHNLSYLRELFERYDFDGIELDWMRFGYHFKPGHEEQGRLHLNQFMDEVKQIATQYEQQRGHKIKIAARVPTRPMFARGLGMDGVEWARENLIDMLIPTPFFSTADLDIPVELWRELIGKDSNVQIAPCMEIRLQATPGLKAAHNTIETMRAFTTSMLHRGADHIYLFNHMDCDTTPQGEYQQFLTEPGSMETALKGTRRYPVTYVDTFPPGTPQPVLLPLPIDDTNPAQVRIHIGPKPTNGKITIRAGIAQNNKLEQAKFRARLNSTPAAPIQDLPPDDKTFPNAARIIQFDVPLTAAQPAYNLIELWTESDQPTQQLVWAEIVIQP